MAGTGLGRHWRVTLYLLMLNLLVLAAGIGVERYARDRVPALSEFNAGKIRFWSQPAAYKPPPAAAAPVSAETAKPADVLCLEIADLNQARYQEMDTALKASGLAGQCSYSFDKRLAWWVFWPPEYEAGRRDKVVKAIQAAGVKDFLPITQGAMAQAFSLGIFAGEAQALQYRDALRGKGLDKVEFGPRPSMGSGRLGCALNEPGRLAAFRSGLPAWARPVAEGLCTAAVAPDAATPPPR